MSIIKLCTLLESADSLMVFQDEIAAMIDKMSSTPAEILIEDFLDKALNFGLKVLAAFIIYCIGAWLIRKFKRILARIFEKKGTDAAIASFVQSLVTIALTILVIITTVGTLGIDTTSLAALLAGGGMAIGMALNGTVQNFAGGIMILVFRPFQSGDYIKYDEFEGTVTEVNIVSTKLTTSDNRIIIIPNGALSNGTINNFSHNTVRRVEWIIDVEYGCSAEETKKHIMNIIKNDSRIMSMENGAPADPFIGLSMLAASSVQFTVRAWVKKENYWPVKFAINEQIYEKLPKLGINFPYQKLDINILNK